MENTRSAGEMRQTRSSPSFQGAGDPSLLRWWHVFFYVDVRLPSKLAKRIGNLRHRLTIIQSNRNRTVSRLI